MCEDDVEKVECRRSFRTRRAPEKLAAHYLHQVEEKAAKKSNNIPGKGGRKVKTKKATGKGKAKAAAAAPPPPAACAATVGMTSYRSPITAAGCTGAAVMLQETSAADKEKEAMFLKLTSEILTAQQAAESASAAALRAQADRDAAAYGLTPDQYEAILRCTEIEENLRRGRELVRELAAEVTVDQAALAKSQDSLAAAQQLVAELSERLSLAAPGPADQAYELLCARLHDAQRAAENAALKVFECTTFVDVSVIRQQEAERELANSSLAYEDGPFTSMKMKLPKGMLARAYIAKQGLLDSRWALWGPAESAAVLRAYMRGQPDFSVHGRAIP